MPVIQGSLSIAANTAVENLISGSQFEFSPYDAQVDIGLCGSAAGLVVDVSTGQDVVTEAMAVNTANRFPVLPDDFVVTDMAASGERIKLRARNTTGGALTIFWCVRLMRAR